MITCKESSRLISQGLDTRLGIGQRASLRLHLLLCTACTRVKTQLDFLHRAAPKYPGPEDDSDHK